MPSDQDIAHLRRGGVSLVVDLSGGRLPRILHWGADLGELDGRQLADLRTATLPTIGDSAVTYPQPVPVVPQLAEGWLGRPGVTGNRHGRAFAPWFREATSSVAEDRIESVASDPESALTLTTRIGLTMEGVVTLDCALRNDGTAEYALDGVEPALPLPDTADELLDLSGRWALERVPQRHDAEPPMPISSSSSCSARRASSSAWTTSSSSPSMIAPSL